MASSTLDPDVLPISDRQLGKEPDNHPPGTADNSEGATEADTDSNGTGERGSIERGNRVRSPEMPDSVEQVATDNEGGEDIVAADERELDKQKRVAADAKKAKRDQDLDDALEGTFPASDPVNLTAEAPKKVAKAPNSN